MGGRGSGTWHRWNTATTVEQTKRIDVRAMQRNGYLNPGSGSLSWTRGGEPSGHINYRSTHDTLHLSYRIRSYGEKAWTLVEQTILIERTPCHFGGTRPWFRCSHCHRRVAVLCGHGRYFWCRHCYGLPYGSQRESYHARMERKALKIRTRLGADDNLFESVWRKPKWMRWATFKRLVASEKVANGASMAVMAQRLGIRL